MQADEMEQEPVVSTTTAEPGRVLHPNHAVFRARYGILKRAKLPRVYLEMDQETFGEELEQLEKEFSEKCGGLNREQMKIIARFKPTAIMFQHAYTNNGNGLIAL